MRANYLLVFLGLATIVCANPTTNDNRKAVVAGAASHLITKTLLQNQIDSANNFVFSPLGFSSILAILNEGARGQTQQELRSLLGFPENLEDIRFAYENTLKPLANANPQQAPQFKTWLYIYTNNSVENQFKQDVEQFYGVEVKEIRRYDEDFINEPNSENTTPQEELTFPDEDEEKANAFDKLKENIIKAEENIQVEKEASKFDRVVDDKQYVEVPVIKNMTETPAEEATTVGIDESEAATDVPTPENAPQESEILKLMEKHIIKKRTKSAFIEDDVASALSGNSIVGRNSNAQNDTDAYESKMLLFNGLYFRGNWRQPFQKLRSDPDDVFYNANAQKSRITMMRTRDLFRTGYISFLDSDAIEIPYENERYTLLIIMPKSQLGVKSVIKQFSRTTLQDINSQLTEKLIHLAIPKFKVETTGRAEKSLSKEGANSLFSADADLSGISGTQKLHVDELVQHVSVRVDEGAISQNFLSATNLLRSSGAEVEAPEEKPAEELIVNQPFLFFVRDIVDDIVIVSGKICHVAPNKPVSFFKKPIDKESNDE